MSREIAMLPVELLISEHRLINHAVSVLKKEQQKIVASGKVDPNFIVIAVDFFRTYVDRYHRGKEEGILFEALSRRKLSEADAAMLREMILEHALARKTLFNLEKLKESYIAGKTEALSGMVESLDTLIELYPMHIEKEDKRFLYASMQYFTAKEQEEMLQKFLEYNRNFTDNRYKQVIETVEREL
ncbi:MAG TPA: hemerythrin domain-containing protein [Candidatus Limnocylindrales bacterium]|nr:hemerythrin domain-containing protein [Candidatus Limnocylindrales bacterium]